MRKTGGLNDTVFDVDDDEERAAGQGMVTNGYNFEGTDAGGVDYALNRALAAWNNDKQVESSSFCQPYGFWPHLLSKLPSEQHASPPWLPDKKVEAGHSLMSWQCRPAKCLQGSCGTRFTHDHPLRHVLCWSR